MPAMIAEMELQSPLVRAGVAYWTAKKGARALPARGDFDPLIEVPELAPYMMLKDVRLQPLDFRYRLVGSAVRHHLERDPTGQWMTAIPGQGPGNPLWDYHAEAVATRAPVFLRPAYVGPHREFLHIESVLLPLATDHEHVDMLMIFVDFLRGSQEASRAARHRP
ncbi:PAS domain-containing protein [Dongia sedimenti]|uniref:PAS domain-containing protein n=1 Tax=Dongia sedimenti TaxID=3064282 RepID=A0ABU0YKF6_9PROT|nr:PAS domain-containing protein [Rhodospirillaceae bacterium R-7]